VKALSKRNARSCLALCYCIFVLVTSTARIDGFLAWTGAHNEVVTILRTVRSVYLAWSRNNGQDRRATRDANDDRTPKTMVPTASVEQSDKLFTGDRHTRRYSINRVMTVFDPFNAGVGLASSRGWCRVSSLALACCTSSQTA